MNNLNEKIKASLMFLSYFDTLGFKNSEWEFNFDNVSKLDNEGKANYVWTLIIHQYHALGGNDINISKIRKNVEKIWACLFNINFLQSFYFVGLAFFLYNLL